MNANKTELTAIAAAAATLSQASCKQLDLLESKVDLVLVGGSIKGGVKEANGGQDGKSRDLWQLPPQSLKVFENFNPRVETPEYLAHIRSLADSMKANGFYQDKPLAGYARKMDGGKTEIYVYEGHSRLRAVLLAISEGAPIEKVPLSIAQEGKSLEDLMVAMVRGNEGRKLTFYENGVMVKRLSDAGWDNETISTRLGFDKPAVESMLRLMAIDRRIRDLVAFDILSATLALQTVDKHGSKAYDKLVAAQGRANAQGKQKITARFTEGAAFKKAASRAAEPMFEALKKVQADPAFAQLSADTQAMLADLVKQLNAAQAEGEKGAETDAETVQPEVELKAA
jgi:hypothetical protein